MQFSRKITDGARAPEKSAELTGTEALQVAHPSGPV